MRARWAWTLSGVYGLVLTYVMLSTNPWWILGKQSSVQQAVDRSLADYLQHALVFLVFGTLVAAAARASQRPSGIVVTTLLITYAAMLETLQYVVPRRVFEFTDLLANVVGVTVPLLVIRAVVLTFGSRQETAKSYS